MTRTKPAEQRRADLLAAGQAMFLAKGIAATSLEEITNRAGVSKGLFYLYFHSKEDLVLALQEQFSDQFAERIRAAVDAQADWAAKLDACVQASFEYYQDLHDLHEVLFHHAGDVGPVGRAGPRTRHEPTHALLTRVIGDLLAEGTAAGAFEVADPETTAVLCYASMHAFDRGFRGRGGPSDARLVQAARQLFRRAAGVPGALPGRRVGYVRPRPTHAASMADRYHSASGHGIIGRRRETIVACGGSAVGTRDCGVRSARGRVPCSAFVPCSASECVEPGGRGWENGGDEAADGRRSA
jgi:TetR/AcrR family transcriptional regulator, transcriptional repressor for nem operon